MNTCLPEILGCGVFNSKNRFPNQTYTSPRTVLHYEIELFLEDGGVSILNGRAYEIKKGHCLIAKPKDIRYSRLHFQAKYIHFTCSDAETTSFVQSLPPFMEGDFLEILSPYFDAAHEALLSVKEFRNIYTSSALLRLLCKVRTLKEKSQENCLHNDSNTPIQIALRYMQEHYKDPIDTLDVANACGWSVSHFHRKFLSIMELPPITYLNRLRVLQAKKYLLDNDKPLSIIAEACGFSTSSYFSRVFKSIVGVSPSTYRKNTQHPIL